MIINVAVKLTLVMSNEDEHGGNFCRRTIPSNITLNLEWNTCNKRNY